MMKKVLIGFILLILIGIISIPYWTGREIERQFPHLNESLYKRLNLKVLDSTYQRSWFHSYAETLLLSYNNQRFILVQKINHGFWPIALPKIHSTLHLASDPEFKQPALVYVQTEVQINGDSVSRIKMPNLGFQDKQADLQWQGLQGVVSAKRDFSKMQVELHNPRIQLVTDQGQIIIQNASMTADMQLLQKQGEATVSMPFVRLTGKKKPPVVLQGIQLAAENNIIDKNFLKFTLKTGLQEIKVGSDHYGPGIGNFELDRWHIPTLLNIRTALREMQSLPPQQRQNLVMLRLVPYGITLLKNKPEFAMTRLNFNTPEGELSSKLQVKIEQDLSPFALFNPSMLLNAVTAQLEISIPQSILDDSTDKNIKQQLKKWLDEGRLIPTADNQYYYSQIHLKNGILQINGKTIPISTFLK